MVINIFVWFIVTFCIGGQLASEDNPYLRAIRGNYLAQNTNYGYVEVRPGAHIFYWLYYADGTQKDATNKPLIIWLQGGPTFPASGFGNFGEIGPLTMDFKQRKHTWVKGRNLLFIDQPVGSGFSYVKSDDLYAQTDYQMAEDVSRAIKLFYEQHEKFRNTPTYVIGQHYGGKLCPRVAMNLYTAIKNKSLEMNFKGIGIGNGWVNPKESILGTPNFLYQSGLIDRHLFLNSIQTAHELFGVIENNDTIKANQIFTSFYDKLSDGIFNLNNIYKTSPIYNGVVSTFVSNMNKFIKPTLPGVNQTIRWSYLNGLAYTKVLLQGSLFAPSVSFLENVLTETNLKVAIYNGNLDAITPVAGASNWVYELNWPFKENFAKARRQPIRGQKNGYFKELKKLSFWSVLRAGQWVPDDNPEAMEHILEYLMTDSSSTSTKTILEHSTQL